MISLCYRSSWNHIVLFALYPFAQLGPFSLSTNVNFLDWETLLFHYNSGHTIGIIALILGLYSKALHAPKAASWWNLSHNRGTPSSTVTIYLRVVLFYHLRITWGSRAQDPDKGIQNPASNSATTAESDKTRAPSPLSARFSITYSDDLCRGLYLGCCVCLGSTSALPDPWLSLFLV